jgi:hypothetical protein
LHTIARLLENTVKLFAGISIFVNNENYSVLFRVNGRRHASILERETGMSDAVAAALALDFRLVECSVTSPAID